jgi:hypothetical protein
MTKLAKSVSDMQDDADMQGFAQITKKSRGVCSKAIEWASTCTYLVVVRPPSSDQCSV